MRKGAWVVIILVIVVLGVLALNNDFLVELSPFEKTPSGISLKKPALVTEFFIDDYGVDISENPNVASYENVEWDGVSGYMPIGIGSGELTGNEQGIARLFHFNDDLSDGMTIDSSSNEVDGVCMGNTCPIYDTVNQKVGTGAYDFDGTDDHIVAIDDGTLENLQQFTYMAWINPRGDGSQMIFSKYRSNKELRLSGSGSAMYLRGSVGADTFARSNSASGSISKDVWQFVVMTYDDLSDRKVRLYINGVEANYDLQDAAAGNLEDDSGHDLFVGRRSVDFDREFDGLIDEVAVFNRVLSAGEIQQIYNLMNTGGTNGNFESKRIGTDGKYYGLTSSWSESESGVNMEVSVDGIEWCEVLNGQNLAGSECDPVKGVNGFKYRVTFSGDTLLDKVRFDWDPNVPPTECADDIDNENPGDGLTDEADPGCWDDPTNEETYNPDLNDEARNTSQCQDGFDNDNDGWTDLEDRGCDSPQDYDERGGGPADTECSNGIDDVDADNFIDGHDPHCDDAFDSEHAQCEDGIDNENPPDGLIDIDDPGCHSDGDPNNPASYTPNDDDERDTGVKNDECFNGGDDDEDGKTDYEDWGCIGPNWQETQDDYGWTLHTASPNGDTIITFVSSSGQGTCRTYTIEELEDPGFNFNTIETCNNPSTAYINNIRDGFPDWLLLKRGDVWNEVLINANKAGRSNDKRILIGSYGDVQKRPLLKNSKIKRGGWIANTDIIDLELYTTYRDPTHPDFDPNQQCNTCDNAVKFSEGGENVLLEGLRVHFYASRGFEIEDPDVEPFENFGIRRNIVRYNYNDAGGGHSQGFRGRELHNGVIEDNLWDHNGWHPTAGASRDQFKHNLYVVAFHNMTLRNNIFSRGSNGAHKIAQRESSPIGPSFGYVIENNFYTLNQEGVGLDGNRGSDYEDEWLVQDSVIRNNVAMGHKGAEASSKSTSNVTYEDNIFVSRPMLLLGQTKEGRPFITQLACNDDTPERCPEGDNDPDNIDYTHRDLTIRGNIFIGSFVGLPGGQNPEDKDNVAVLRARADSTNIKFEDNILQSPGKSNRLIDFRAETGYGAWTFSNNKYYTDANPDKWFRKLVGGTQTSMTWSDWVSESRETGVIEEVQFADAERNLSRYHTEIIGGNGEVDDFFDEASNSLSKFDWDTRYTADEVNDYIREGFTVA